MFAAARNLDNLTVFVDQNGKQPDGYTVDVLDSGDIAAKFEAFGFETQRVEGNEVAQVYEAVVKAAARCGKPHAIILHTTKGAGVPEVEQTVANHNMNFVPGQVDGWLEELQRQLDAMGGGKQ